MRMVATLRAECLPKDTKNKRKWEMWDLPIWLMKKTPPVFFMFGKDADDIEQGKRLYNFWARHRTHTESVLKDALESLILDPTAVGRRWRLDLHDNNYVLTPEIAAAMKVYLKAKAEKECAELGKGGKKNANALISKR